MSFNQVSTAFPRSTPFIPTIHHLFPFQRWSCTYCWRDRIIERRLIGHVRSHIVIVNDIVYCDDCGRRYRTEYAAINHFMRAHIRSKYYCELCRCVSTNVEAALEHAFDHYNLVQINAFCPQKHSNKNHRYSIKNLTNRSNINKPLTPNKNKYSVLILKSF